VSSDDDEPKLVTFLAERGVHEQDPVRRVMLTDLISQWRALGPGDDGDAIWDAMVALSREYVHATGYEKHWSR
jgi:hypothetical protein